MTPERSRIAAAARLNRLRDVYGDQLLVREKGGMAVTERALTLREHARRALTELDAMHAGAEKFDAASSQQTFGIGSPDFIVGSFLASTVEAFRR